MMALFLLISWFGVIVGTLVAAPIVLNKLNLLD